MAKFNAFSREKGWIELICGPMFAGKSEELLRKLKRLEYAEVPYMVFKPKIDTRSKNFIKSRDGRQMNAIEISSPYEIFDYILQHVSHPQVIAIDEIQFCSEEIVEVCETLANAGIIVYASGLDKDFRNEPFKVTSKMLSYAEYVTKLVAVCVECGAPGTCTQRIIDGKPATYDSPIILVGNQESYSVRCRHHHKVPKKPICKQASDFVLEYKKNK